MWIKSSTFIPAVGAIRPMRAFLPVAALGLLVYQLHAGVVVYEGADPGADIGDPRPNSDAAAALLQN